MADQGRSWLATRPELTMTLRAAGMERKACEETGRGAQASARSAASARRARISEFDFRRRPAARRGATGGQGHPEGREIAAAPARMGGAALRQGAGRTERKRKNNERDRGPKVP